MGFFTRLPETIRQMGLLWRGPVHTSSVDRRPSFQVSTVLPPRAETPQHVKHPVKLRTICTSDGRLGQRSQSVRVVISGRMADVCAELDRLVALEAQPTLH